MPGTAFFLGATGLYAGAAALYSIFLVAGKTSLLRWARITLGLGFALHFLEIGARGLGGLHPVTSAHEVMGFLAWLVVGTFLAIEGRFRMHAVGALVAPAALVLLLAARLAPTTAARIPLSDLGILGRVHISLATAGVAIFAFATLLALTYLFEDKQLKRKELGGLVRRGVALDTLDKLVYRCAQLGLPLFTMALITGVAWTVRLGERFRAEYGIAMVAWFAFAGLLATRRTLGWRGRRPALMTVIGFAAALLVVTIYLARRAWGA